MGTLNSCLKSKALRRYKFADLSVGSATMQGFRIAQEDYHKVVKNFRGNSNLSMFAVFDGHGGCEASSFLEKNIVSDLEKIETFDNESISKCLLNLDKKFISDENNEIREQGSTCILVIVEKTKNDKGQLTYNVNCANVGDSRCIVIDKKGNYQIMSDDHKPNNKIEEERIQKAGGTVSSNRVDGTLAVSRAFGDYNLKNNKSLPQLQQKVVSLPSFTRTTCEKGDILLITCDGVFETLKRNEIADHVHKNFYSHKDPAKMLSQLFEFAEMNGSSDNMTGIIVQFGESISEDSSQFVPGPLFRGLKDGQFMGLYISDAEKNGYRLDRKVRLAAFHEDLKEIYLRNTFGNSKINEEILYEISNLDPWNISINDLAFVVNALNSSITFIDSEISKLNELGILKAIDLKKELDKKEPKRQILNKELEKNVNHLFSLWENLKDFNKKEEHDK